jgi:tetratricopeptide (TPR) repeat protein
MTKNLQKKGILFLVIFLFLFLSSCSGLKKEQIQRQTGHEAKQAQLELEAGDFQKAIDIYKEIYQKYPQDPTIRSSYIKTLESIKNSGDRAFERNNYELAGNIYEILAKNWFHFADFSQFLSFNKNFLEKKIKTSRCLFIEEQVSSYLKAGKFQRAIDICKEIYPKYPQDSTVRSIYIKTLESIKSSGDRAFERSDFSLAGCVYEILLKNFSSVSHLNGSFSFNREGLTEKIRNCKKILFENGLEQYRSGNLKQAISLWKSILAFDPENQEIKKVVDMATLQFKNLQKAK